MRRLTAGNRTGILFAATRTRRALRTVLSTGRVVIGLICTVSMRSFRYAADEACAAIRTRSRFRTVFCARRRRRYRIGQTMPQRLHVISLLSLSASAAVQIVSAVETVGSYRRRKGERANVRRIIIAIVISAAARRIARITRTAV